MSCNAIISYITSITTGYHYICYHIQDLHPDLTQVGPDELLTYATRFSLGPPD